MIFQRAGECSFAARWLRATPALVEILEGRTIFSAGDLDPTFANGGVLTERFDGPDQVYTQASALDSHQRLLILGTRSFQRGVADDLIVSRFNRNGTVDTTFGDGGIAEISAGAQPLDTHLAVSPDGSIVFAGIDHQDGRKSTLKIGIFNADGTVETSFADDGVLTIRGPARLVGFAKSPRPLIQRDGKIVLAFTSRGRFIFMRFNPDGSSDASFGDHGMEKIAFVEVSADRINDLKVLSNGRIILAGAVTKSLGPDSFSVEDYPAAIRLKPNGRPDDSYDDHGRAIVPIKGLAGSAVENDSREGIAATIARDGSILWAANIVRHSSASGALKLIALTRKGLLDYSFASKGVARVSANFIDSRAVFRGDSGNIILVGDQSRGASQVAETCVERLTPNLAFDTHFGTGGVGHLTNVDEYRFVDAAMTSDGAVYTSTANSFYDDTLGLTATRLTPAGYRDTGYGEGGVARAADQLTSPSKLAPDFLGVTPGGRILVMADDYVNAGDSFPRRTSVFRYAANGAAEQVRVLPEFISSFTLHSTFAARADVSLVIGNWDWADAPPYVSFDTQRLNADLSDDPTAPFVFAHRVQDGYANLRNLIYHPNGNLLAVYEAAPTADFHDATADAITYLAAFSNDGVERHSSVLLNADPNSRNNVFRVSIASNGDIVVLEEIRSTNPHYIVKRFKSDLSPDLAFGQAGQVDLGDFGSGKIDFDRFSAATLAIQPDGAILVAASTKSSTQILRLLPDGTHDRTFADHGLLTASSDTSVSIAGMISQSDGKFIVGLNFADHFVLNRYTADGQPDPTFTAASLSLPSGDNSAIQNLAVTPGGDLLALIATTHADQSADTYVLAEYQL